jgi:CDP-glucose 4,6-dehydratase
VVVVTSDKCYRNVEWVWGYRENDPLGGQDPYSASKAGAELVFETYNTSFFQPGGQVFAASARAGNVIGGGDWSDNRIVPDCVRALKKNAPITLRSPASTRPWQHVLDPLHGYLVLAERLLQRDARAVGSWNFGPELPANVTVEQVVGQLISRWGRGSMETSASDNPVKESGVLALDSTKAMHYLGWRPIWPTMEAINETADWYRDFLDGKDVVDITATQLARFVAGS